MNKAFVAVVLVPRSFSAASARRQIGSEPTCCRWGQGRRRPQEPRYQRATVSNAGQKECKKYFALIGKVVTVPCER